jgi:hypothetical protein
MVQQARSTLRLVHGRGSGCSESIDELKAGARRVADDDGHERFSLTTI